MENIKNMPPIERPREKLELLGAAAMSDVELLVILLGSGTKDLPINELCHQLLNRIPLCELAGADMPALCETKGIGQAKACLLLAVVELTRRLQRKTGIMLQQDTVIYRMLKQLYRDSETDGYTLVLMTTEWELLATAHAGKVLPALEWVTQLALDAGARRIRLARNGRLHFNRAEMHFNEALKKAAGFFGITMQSLMLFDHKNFKCI